MANMEKELSKIAKTPFEHIDTSEPRKSEYKIVGNPQATATANRRIIPSGDKEILGPSLLDLRHFLRHASINKGILGGLGKDREPIAYGRENTALSAKNFTRR